MTSAFSVSGLTAIALLVVPAAYAQDEIGLVFEPVVNQENQSGTLSESSAVASSELAETRTDPNQPAPVAESARVKPLEMPSQAATVPVGKANQADGMADPLPPPPQQTQAQVAPEEGLIEPGAALVESESSDPVPSVAGVAHHADRNDGILQFGSEGAIASASQRAPQPAIASRPQPVLPTPTPAPRPTAAQTAAPMAAPTLQPASSPELQVLFAGNSESLVARAVGTAEGTRTPNGGKTWAYYGHVDPGNGVWNLGSFSYQHGASSPEEADARQLQRLQQQAQTLRQKAQARGIRLTLEEELNGIDLANQAPRAALSQGGYIDRLQQAHERGLRGSDAILWARTRSYIEPATNRWNAPGLGNTLYSITRDQERRMEAIARTIQAQPQLARTTSGQAALSAQSTQLNGASLAERSPTERLIDQILSLDLPPV